MMKYSLSNTDTFARGTVKVEITAELANPEEATKFLENVHGVYEALGYGD